MEPKFCSVVGKRVDPKECGTHKVCGNTIECEVRQYYGWDSIPNSAPPTPPQQEITQEKRECNMCHQPLDLDSFRERQDGKGLKKTCAACEDKYVKKATPTNKPRKKNGNSVKAKPRPKPAAVKSAPAKPTPEKEQAPPEPSSRAQEKGQPNKATPDLSDFTWLTNTYKAYTKPAIRINKRAILFNPDARKQYSDILKDCETIDIGVKEQDGKLIFAFKPHNDMFGQYRIHRGVKNEFRINISLRPKGFDLDVGPWPVEYADGVFLAEVG